MSETAPVSPPVHRLADVFCGAGGLTLGFTRYSAGRFVPVWAIDNDPDAAATYRANFGDHVVCGDVAAAPAPPAADVVVGGPPCQGFSPLNRKRAGDERRALWRPFFEIVRLSGASVFLVENVPPWLDSTEFQAFLRTANDAGFQLTAAVLCAADYGVPQIRRRAFVLGCAFASPAAFFPPPRTHAPRRAEDPAPAALFPDVAPSLRPWVTVREAIGDLPAVPVDDAAAPPPLNLHFGRRPSAMSLARYQVVAKEGMNRFDLQRLSPELTPRCWRRKTSGGTDVFGRLWWDRPAVTIRTEFFKPEKGRYLHPAEHRPLTHREAARLQSFPDDFHFCGTRVSIARQIGNAVPPVLAGRLADAVYALLQFGDATGLRRPVPKP